MSDEVVTEPSQARSASPRPRLRLGAVVAIALAAGLGAWIALRHREAATPKHLTGATAASVSELRGLAASVRHPVFWLGPKHGFAYELLRTSNGNIYIRYLPSGVAIGTNDPYLTVATYPFHNAFAALSAIRASNRIKVAHGGIAVPDESYPKSVHIAYPGVDYEVEVFDPTPGAAMSAVAAGDLQFFGTLPRPAQPPAVSAASIAGLKALAATVGHPIYWDGPKPGYTYELTRTSSGNVFVRYLPAGVHVGTRKPYLTVATYPFPNALRALQRTVKDPSAVTKLPGGGIAVTDSSYPKSVHLAWPHVDVEVEVFDPDPAAAQQVATSGAVTTVG
jgi:hypothetical protein